MKSKGMSNQPQAYDFTDPGANGSTNGYYRIRAVDINGHFSYSKTAELSLDEPGKVQIYPNPSQGLYSFRFYAQPGEQIRINIYNASGMLLEEKVFTGNGYTKLSRSTSRLRDIPMDCTY